jgi:hypothetical protein
MLKRHGKPVEEFKYILVKVGIESNRVRHELESDIKVSMASDLRWHE